MPVSYWGKERVILPKPTEGSIHTLNMEKSHERVLVRDKKNLFNWVLLKDVKFLIFLFNNILWNIGSLILLVICTDFAHKHGVPKESGAMLISAIGFCSLIGRVGIAFTGGHQSCNRFYIFIASTAVSGLAIALFPMSGKYASMLTFSIIYGLAFGIQVGVLAVVTVELFGVRLFTSAYGYLMFGNGAGAMLGPPIAGKKIQMRAL